MLRDLTNYPKVCITDCPHRAIHEDLEGHLIEEHDDHTATIQIDDDTCRANSWKILNQAKSPPAKVAKTLPRAKLANLSISQVAEDRYSVSYASRNGQGSLQASNITIPELEMALNSIQLLQASQ